MRRVGCAVAACMSSLFGCSADILVEGPPECHAGWELRDGVCVVQEIYFEGGTFMMGRGDCFPVEDHAAEFASGRCELADEAHEVTVEPFYMDAVEMTPLAFIDPTTLHPAPCASLSVDCVDPGHYAALVELGGRDAAGTFCAELGKAPPTEAQWEFAASGGGLRRYPWGDEEPSCDRAAIDEACPLVAGRVRDEVARFPPTPEGLYDLAGNLAEVVLPGDPTPGYPQPPFVQTPREECDWPPCPISQPDILRGGSWRDFGALWRFSTTHRALPRDGVRGFRCVRSP